MGRVEAAAPRFRLERIASPDAPSFAAAYAELDAFFGARGELEERATLASFVHERVIPYGDGMEGHYHLLAAWEGGQLAGVRDCYVDLDLRSGVCVVALSHTLVLPPWRRSGLSALFRTAPVTLARRAVAERIGAGAAVPILVAGEMEPIDPDQPDTLTRLLAYARAGFRVLDPQRLPYSQPDFRPDHALEAHSAIALLPVVRWVGHEGALAMPVTLAAAFPRLFHACHRRFLPAARVDPSEVHALRTLTRTAGDVALLPLPRHAADHDAIAPLTRDAVWPAYPRYLRGP